MEVYDSLPHDLKEHVRALEAKEEMKAVVQEFLYTRAHILKKYSQLCCGNCAYHGSPCLNCAEEVYQGNAGPGFCLGKRIFLPDSTDEGIAFNMMVWAHFSGGAMTTMSDDDFEWYLKYLPQHWN